MRFEVINQTICVNGIPVFPTLICVSNAGGTYTVKFSEESELVSGKLENVQGTVAFTAFDGNRYFSNTKWED